MSAAFSTTRTHIAGIPVADLARQFGTPTYVYDASVILQRLADLAAFDHVRYAQKACSNLAVLDLLRRHGALVDAVSAGEVRRALAAGYAGGHAAADRLHGRHLRCRGPRSLRGARHSRELRLARHDRAPWPPRPRRRRITLRINPGFGHGHSRKTNTGGDQSKHGIWHEQIGLCLETAARHQIVISGVHMHIGSGTDLAHLSQVCAAMEKAAGRSVPRSHRSVPAAACRRFIARATRTSIWRPISPSGTPPASGLEDRFGHAVGLEIEPGRYLVVESGFLVAEIRAVKRQGMHWFYLLDAGFNNLARPILYGSYHPMSIVPRDAGSRPDREVIVGGPLCESGDIFTQAEGGFVCPRTLPEAEVGQLLVIECAGAYGFVMGSNYNSRPLAAEVLIHEGRPHLVRQRQTFEDLIRGESIPG